MFDASTSGGKIYIFWLLQILLNKFLTYYLLDILKAFSSLHTWFDIMIFFSYRLVVIGGEAAYGLKLSLSHEVIVVIYSKRLWKHVMDLKCSFLKGNCGTPVVNCYDVLVHWGELLPWGIVLSLFQSGQSVSLISISFIWFF